MAHLGADVQWHTPMQCEGGGGLLRGRFNKAGWLLCGATSVQWHVLCDLLVDPSQGNGGGGLPERRSKCAKWYFQVTGGTIRGGKNGFLIGSFVKRTRVAHVQSWLVVIGGWQLAVGGRWWWLAAVGGW